MRPDANIVARRRRNELGATEQLVYEWQGGTVVHISRDLVDEVTERPPREPGEQLQVGPFLLRLVEWDYARALGVFVRDTPRGWALLVGSRAAQLLDLCYRRCILTLVVWGLADYHPNTVPSWRDVHGPWRRR